MTAVKEIVDIALIPKTHLSLNVKNIGRSVTFYEVFFGVPAHKRRPGYANFNLVNPPLKLALQEAAVTDGAGPLSHLGIQVATAEEVQSARERLISSGLATFDEGDTVCCYARQDKIWAHDPDGNEWEVYVLLDEMNDEEDDHFLPGGFAGESTCCGGDNTCCGAVAEAAPMVVTSIEAAQRRMQTIALTARDETSDKT